MSFANKILLVDDDDVSNYLNKTILSDLELFDEIDIATNGEEALSFLSELCKNEVGESPLYILLDLKMPVMDGFGFLEEVKTKDWVEEKLQIYILSSSSNKSDIERAKNYNVRGFINKPLTKDKVLSLFN